MEHTLGVSAHSSGLFAFCTGCAESMNSPSAGRIKGWWMNRSRLVATLGQSMSRVATDRASRRPSDRSPRMVIPTIPRTPRPLISPFP